MTACPARPSRCFDLARAQEAFDVGGLSQVSVVAADGVAVDDLRSRLGGALGSTVQAASSQDTAAAADAARDQLGFLPMMLGVLAVTALLIGGFLIANTFSILVAQRTREFATLRAVGATGRQVTLSVLGEAVVVGVVASAAGTLLGVAATSRVRFGHWQDGDAVEALTAVDPAHAARGHGPVDGRRIARRARRRRAGAGRQRRGAAIRDPEAARQAQLARFDQILGLVTVLLVLAVVIALLGITNTLALSIFERTRETGLLRAIGSTRTQIAAMVRWETLLVAVLGGVVGIALGCGVRVGGRWRARQPRQHDPDRPGWPAADVSGGRRGRRTAGRCAPGLPRGAT